MKILDEQNVYLQQKKHIFEHMDTLDRLPFKARKAVFERLEQLVSKANMTPQERAQYEEEWKVYNDFYNIVDYAELKGRKAGRLEGIEKGI